MITRFRAYTFFIFFVSLLFFSISHPAFAAINSSGVSSSSHTAQVCENTSCTVTSTSPINFGYFTGLFSGSSSYNLNITDSALTGYIWGTGFGWVVLNCANTTSGCSSTNGNFKVANTSAGLLSGYAWGENTGWINFGPFSGTSPAVQSVIINTAGQFSGTSSGCGTPGYAWAQNFGWIKFDCSGSNYTVTASEWRPSSQRTTCNDGVDNDGDNFIDYPNDSGCSSLADTTETSGGGGSGSGSTGPTGPTGTTTTGTTTGATTGGESSGDTGGTGEGTTGGDTGTTGRDTGGIGEGTTGGDTGATTGGEASGDTGGTGEGTTGGDTGAGTSGGGRDSGGGSGRAIALITESLAPITAFISQGVSQSFTFAKNITKEAGKKAQAVLDTPTGDIVAKTVTTVGVVSGASVSIATALFANPLSFTELFLIPIRLWALLMAALGIKKRNKPWGTVYDSVTKQPLDPAYVSLQDLQENEIATSITDLDGRYGFLMNPGTYKIIAHKTNYIFPSVKLTGKVVDEIYNDLYFGDTITVTEQGQILAKNIPLDPLKFDWNEFAKKEQHLMKFYSKRSLWLSYVSNLMFSFGFVVTTIALLVAPKTYNIITFAMYCLLLVLKRTVLKPKPQGNVTDSATGNPLSFAIVRLFNVGTEHEVIHKITDKMGNYYCLVPNGSYYIKVERKNLDETYTRIHTSLPIEVTKGYVDVKIKI